MTTTNKKKNEILITFDTTGSNYPALTQIRRQARELVRKLFSEIPGIRIAVGVHGDYNDRPYDVKFLDFTKDEDKLVEFIDKAERTSGFGNGGECYELVLHRSRKLDWSPKGPNVNKAIVMIGDEPAHGPTFYQNTQRLNWREEVKALGNEGVRVYGVQSLNWGPEADRFYEALADLSGGFHIRLDQFGHIVDTVLAICYNEEGGEERVKRFEKEIEASGRMSRGLDSLFTRLMPKRDSKGRFLKADLKAVPAGRFQVLDVDKDEAIKDFVEGQGLQFATGRGFYEFTKTETIQKTKEIILQDRASGDLFEGDYARELLGIAKGIDVRIRPVDLKKYRVFVQSTSNNRKLLKNTSFLYQV